MFGNLINMDSTLWDEFRRLQREMDTVFNRGAGRPNIRAVAGNGFPAINIGTTPNAVQVYVFAPGIDMSTLDLSIQQNLLTIAGERKVAEPEPGESKSHYLRERFKGSFRRVINLPDDVNPEQVNAVYRNGVLSIDIGKYQEVKPRQIEVKSA